MEGDCAHAPVAMIIKIPANIVFRRLLHICNAPMTVRDRYVGLVTDQNITVVMLA